jgi:glycosyltransferase involved in cell wall biosynthesis
MVSTVFVVLSFEGPDTYSRVGGLATRVTGLVNALAGRGCETHLVFIGQPELPGHEVQGSLHLHRWCQWISREYTRGAYDGEEAKLADWNRSVPAYLVKELLPGVLSRGANLVILAEEWQTAETLIALDAAIGKRGWKDRVKLIWNANNVYGFHRINWADLSRAATITTVSRYMKYLMRDQGIEARVQPNGIDSHWLRPVPDRLVRPLASALRDRIAVTKVARWDAEKRWDFAVEAVAALKLVGLKPVFFARGGSPDGSSAVLQRIEDLGLTVSRARWEGEDGGSLTSALLPELSADVVLLESLLHVEQAKILYRVSDAVLANSAVEPFGLVGLETMASGGIAAVGSTGEDYVTNGHDSISLQTDDPWEFVLAITRLRNSPAAGQTMRSEAVKSAVRYTWDAVLERSLFPLMSELGVGTEHAPRSPHDVLPFRAASVPVGVAALKAHSATAGGKAPVRRPRVLKAVTTASG